MSYGLKSAYGQGRDGTMFHPGPARKLTSNRWFYYKEIYHDARSHERKEKVM
jgi:hypothetical protein